MGASGAGATAEAGDVSWYRHGKTRPHTPPLVSVRAHLGACGESVPPPRRPIRGGGFASGAGALRATFPGPLGREPCRSVDRAWRCAAAMVSNARTPRPRALMPMGDVVTRATRNSGPRVHQSCAMAHAARTALSSVRINQTMPRASLSGVDPGGSSPSCRRRVRGRRVVGVCLRGGGQASSRRVGGARGGVQVAVGSEKAHRGGQGAAQSAQVHGRESAAHRSVGRSTALL